MVKLYIIRHAQSLLNIGKGKTPNCGLSDFGKEQAKRVGDFFRDKEISKIYCSPFRRVIETATPLAIAKEQPVYLVPEICEFYHDQSFDYRDFSWQMLEEILNDFPIARYEGELLSAQWWPTWPEEQEDVRLRVRNFFEETVKSHMERGESIAIFGHGATTGELKALVDVETINPCPNGCVFAYDLDERGQLKKSEVHLKHLGEYTSGLTDTAY